MGDHITLHLSFGACRAYAGPLEPIGQASEPARTSPEARGLDGSTRPGPSGRHGSKAIQRCLPRRRTAKPSFSTARE